MTLLRSLQSLILCISLLVLISNSAHLASEEGYHLFAAEARSPPIRERCPCPRLIMFSMARGAPAGGISLSKPFGAVEGGAGVWGMLAAEDRLLLIQNDAQAELHMQHLVLPQVLWLPPPVNGRCRFANCFQNVPRSSCCIEHSLPAAEHFGRGFCAYVVRNTTQFCHVNVEDRLKVPFFHS